MPENEQQRRKKTRERIAEMKARKQSVINRNNRHQRKQKMRRLIKIGALAEKYLGCEGMATGEFEEVLQGLSKNNL